MNTLTKQQVDEVIEMLVDRSLTFGCLVKDYASGKTMRYAGKYFIDLKMEDFDAFYSLWDGEQELFSQFNDDFSYPENRIVGHPIHLHDLFAKIYDKKWSEEELQNIFPNALSNTEKRRGVTLHRNNIDSELIKLWRPCGFTKSLQEIAGRIEWEEVCKGCGEQGVANNIRTGDFHVCEASKEIEIQAIAKPSPETDLLLFLYNLFDLTK